MARIHTLCVFCGSSNSVDQAHLDAADALGRMAAQRSVKLVFGGGKVGLMGALADGALVEGGQVVGVIPTILHDREVAHDGVDELVVVETMHHRKMHMYNLSDGFCILPGGLGTLDEAFEIITWKQLRLHDKPIVLVDLDGYWGPLIELLEHQGTNGFLYGGYNHLVTVVDRIEAVFDHLAESPAPGFEDRPEHF